MYKTIKIYIRVKYIYISENDTQMFIKILILHKDDLFIKGSLIQIKHSLNNVLTKIHS